ncbi:uncharacterized protein LOC106635879 [Copidosoma floridanum]|uniref:uncharacterized protein LOC106635879 n=1 Tax=Copidosoma floridanum TaxID=29053 RepID=UPI0006C9D162|nr:uncharacterized protein LOC106635879 [Copidosoma floridanum]
MVMSIEDLNDDCVIDILSYLPVLDRLRSYRVCKRWKTLGELSWQKTKALSLRRDFWGLSSESRFIVNRHVLKKLLEICGRYLVHVSLSNVVQKSGLPDTNVRVKSCKFVFTLIRELCPNVRSIDAGEPVQDCTLEYVASHYSDLTHFAVREAKNFEPILALLFSNNRNLRHVRLEGCRINGTCLLALNPQALREFYFVDNQVGEPQHLIDALEGFRNIRILNLTRVAVEDDQACMDHVLEAVRQNAASVEHLYLKFYDNHREYIDPSFVAEFTNLEKLHIDGDIIVNDKFLAIVAANCTKLKSLQLSNSTCLTDAGIASIGGLPELRWLSLNALEGTTDGALGGLVNLRLLEVRRCPKVGVGGLSKLLGSSRSIAALWCICCGRVPASELLEAAWDPTGTPRNLALRIDNSDSEDSPFVTDVQTLFASEDRVVRRVRQLCYECFKSPSDACDVCCNLENEFTVQRT